MNTQRPLSLKWLVPGVVVILVLAVISAGAQRMPPTAREAATMPQFAQQLARPATPLQRPPAPARGGACSASRWSQKPQRSLPQDLLYDNGPYNGTTDAWAIDFGFAVSDSFTAPSGSTIQGLSFVYWDASTSDLLTSVDMGIASTSFGGTFQTLTGVNNTFLGTNQYGYALYQADYAFTDIYWPGGVGYITLQNACSTSGCSVSNPIYWDENSGPSTAYEGSLGSIPSETFALAGYVGLPHSPCMPERSGGFQVIHNFTGQDEGSYPSGLVINQAGELYGPTHTIGGTVFKMLKAGSDWLLSTLYTFAGGPQGSAPEELIIGRNGILYGPAFGGIQNCSYYGPCGLIFSLRPAPTACLTGSCSWSENVVDSFTGPTDAWDGRGLVSDRAGNLFGVSAFGGALQQGVVFELTTSPAGWVESIVYNFTGGSDGGDPTSLLVGKDGSLYGLAGNGGAHGGGVVFQLTPAAGSWTEVVLYDLPSATFGTNPHSLVQDSAGSLFGEYEFWYQPLGGEGQQIGVVFTLTPSVGNWVYTELQHGDEQGRGNDTFTNLALDAAGNLWGTGGGRYGCAGSVSHGYIFKLVPEGDGWQYSTPVNWDNTEFPTDGALAIDAQGNLYGTTTDCGVHNAGTVWEFTPTQ